MHTYSLISDCSNLSIGHIDSANTRLKYWAKFTHIYDVQPDIINYFESLYELASALENASFSDQWKLIDLGTIVLISGV